MSIVKENGDNREPKRCCFICKQSTRFYVNARNGKSRFSDRNLFELIEMISNVEISSTDVICQICLIKLQNFDEFSTKAVNIQLELKSMIEKKDCEDPFIKKIKIEVDDDETEKELSDVIQLSEEDVIANKVQDTSKEIYPCDHPNCDKIFKTKGKLVFHKTFHVKERKYQCDLCNKFYKTRICLKSHMRIHNNANRRVICDMCGDSFTTKQSVYRHFTTAHLKLRPYICQVCGANFGTLVILRLHLLTHGDGSNKNFACEICSSRFYSKSKLGRHMRGHGEKQFKCSICHRKYTQRYNLNAHIRAVHGNEKVQTAAPPKRFVCQLCGNYFKKNKELENHLKNSHDALPINNTVNT